MRGQTLEEWSVSTGLVVANRGSVQTCVRQQGGSIVDVTFTDPVLARRLQGWEVMEDAETLSDHRYIRFSLSAAPSAPRDLNRHTGDGYPRWTLTRLDRDMVVEAAMVEAWVAESSGPAGALVDVETEAELLGQAMSRVCDAAMPRAGPRPALRSVYWWSAEIARLRATCVARRRRYHSCRRWRTRDADEADHRYERYREAAVALRVAIASAKHEANVRDLESLDGDPFGKPYKRVRGRLQPWAPPLTERLEPVLVDEVVAYLFPSRGPEERPRAVQPDLASEEAPPVSEGEFAGAVSRMRAKDRAPGPDGIPGRVYALALGPLEPRVRSLFTACLRRGQFPSPFRTGKLVLLRKSGRSTDSPSAFRPIVLLDEIGKLFERIISSRLVRHLEETGPDLSEFQFGFRRGRSTLDAISRVRALADEAVTRGEVVLAVSLDIANAFNTMPWSCILDALVFHGVPEYLQRTIGEYLSERFVRYPTREGDCRRQMSCGVPQGSVLGPTLWSIGYDSVLRGANLSGVGVTCYADDTLVTARGHTFRDARVLVTAGVAQVVARIRRLGLEVALHKSEAVCFHGPRMAPPADATITVGGNRIPVRASLKYLGLVLDSRWTFEEHFRLLAPKLVRAAGALSRLLPNLGGPNASCRRLYTGVIRSMALYGAPIWAYSLTARSRSQLRQPQRLMAIRVIRGYRTISCEAACVLAGISPWDLDAESLSRAHWQRVEARFRGEDPPSVWEICRKAREEVLLRWERRVAEPVRGRWTVEAVAAVGLRLWLERDHGVLGFRLVQVLSGHGCFGSYLHQRAGRPDGACTVCVCLSDTALHTLAECPFWAHQRAALAAVVGPDLSLAAVVRSMVASERAWDAVTDFCEDVMSQKREAERVREAEETATRPRRRTAARRQPPLWARGDDRMDR